MIEQSVMFNLTVTGTLKHDCDIKASDLMSFLSIQNNLVTHFSLASISAIYFSLLDYSLPNFQGHH